MMLSNANDYSRDQRPEEQGSPVILRSSNFQPPMFQTGHERRFGAHPAMPAIAPMATIVTAP
jgi:hypothetical protein